jgi:hypothetical protein
MGVSPQNYNFRETRHTKTKMIHQLLEAVLPFFLGQVWLDVTSVAESVRSDKWKLLVACILIDLIGASELGCWDRFLLFWEPMGRFNSWGDLMILGTTEQRN